ncbi:MAG: ABC transporter ATP-binding protein [Natronospirillum sp.]
MLTVTAVHKQFASPEGAVQVLTDVSFGLGAGQALALTGESGSGKSTLLHLIAGLDTPDHGSIQLQGRSVHKLPETQRAALRRQDVGLVFQQFNLISSLTVSANLAFQARLSGRHDPHRHRQLAERLGLSELLDRYPEQLSGGQQQRVAIGRTVLARPQLLLADEPTGNLDETTGDAVLNVMLELVAETGCALLMVTHSQHLANRLGQQRRLEAGRLQ